MPKGRLALFPTGDTRELRKNIIQEAKAEGQRLGIRIGIGDITRILLTEAILVRESNR